jgi:hypothetical protein
LKGIKDGYLGNQWQREMNTEYENQAFCQEGHSRESPPTFITCCIMYTCMLVNSDNGGPLEVHLVMHRAPVAWSPILVLDNIKDTGTLFAKATEHKAALLHASRSENHGVLTTNNLASALRHLGFIPEKMASSNPIQKRNFNRFTNFTEGNTSVEEEAIVTDQLTKEPYELPTGGEQELASNEALMMLSLETQTKPTNRPGMI